MKTLYSSPQRPGRHLHFERRGEDLAVSVENRDLGTMEVITVPGMDIPGAVESLLGTVACRRPVEDHHRGYTAHLPWGAVEIITTEADPELLRDEAMRLAEQAAAFMAASAHVDRQNARFAAACDDVREEYPEYDDLVAAMARLREQAPRR